MQNTTTTKADRGAWRQSQVSVAFVSVRLVLVSYALLSRLWCRRVGVFDCANLSATLALARKRVPSNLCGPMLLLRFVELDVQACTLLHKLTQAQAAETRTLSVPLATR